VTSEWWRGIPAAQATLGCGDGIHRLIWNDGTLTAPDHADPEAERALAALGGEPLACIAMLDAWLRHVEDPNVLVMGSRGPADLIPVPVERPRRPAPRGPAATSRAGVTRIMIASGGRRGHLPFERQDEGQLAQLLSLGGGIGRRLDATVAAYWCERLLDPDAETERLRARLHAALYGRVLATLVAWLGQGDLELTLELVPEGAPPALGPGVGGGIVAALPFRWLVDVWARGLEVIWGRFCLAATTNDDHSWELLTVGPDLGEPATLTLTLPD
jgi:hypothetical protein